MKLTNLLTRTLFAVTWLLQTEAGVQAATYYVATNGNDSNPGTQASPFRNIAKGIAVAAASGDTVQVATGEYRENLTWTNKSLFLKGAGMGQSKIDGNFSGSCLTLTNVPNTARIEGFTIQSGRSDTGGAMHLESSNLAIDKCEFHNNRANFNGAGIYMHLGYRLVTNCVFSSNYSSDQGGAIYQFNSTTDFLNCLFLGNSGTKGGGISGYNAAGNVVHCTFSGNSANDGVAGEGGAIYDDGAVNVYNSIFWGDSASTSLGGKREIATSGFISVNYSCVDGGFNGTSIISADPRFASGYRLQSSSPCINTGTTQAPILPEFDLDGGPRVLGPAPDMGAYEFWTASYGLFVDKALGNDSSGTGGPTAPYKTVVKAIAVAATGSKIYIKQGNYGSDRPRITKALRLVNWGNAGLARVGKP